MGERPRMDDYYVTLRLEPPASGAARVLLRSAAGGDLADATDLFGLVPLGGDGDRPAAAAVRRTGAEAQLLALVTRDERRRRGLGTRLLDGVADALCADGCDVLWAILPAGDQGRWLLGRGFEEAGDGRVELVF